ncbi:MAG: hypothetical protein HN929_12570 [Chloroflexi bacterium]|jgi:hypothetical protein|nr:hypothetical protein [Chloroflexota bacterium]
MEGRKSILKVMAPLEPEYDSDSLRGAYTDYVEPVPIGKIKKMPQYLDPLDFEEAKWAVYMRIDGRYTWLEEVNGRPYAPDLRDIFGPGKFKVAPIGPNGKCLLELSEYHTIGLGPEVD